MQISVVNTYISELHYPLKRKKKQKDKCHYKINF